MKRCKKNDLEWSCVQQFCDLLWKSRTKDVVKDFGVRIMNKLVFCWGETGESVKQDCNDLWKSSQIRNAIKGYFGGRIMYNLVSCYDSMELRDRGDITSDKVKWWSYLIIWCHLWCGNLMMTKLWIWWTSDKVIWALYLITVVKSDKEIWCCLSLM